MADSSSSRECLDIRTPQKVLQSLIGHDEVASIFSNIIIRKSGSGIDTNSLENAGAASANTS